MTDDSTSSAEVDGPPRACVQRTGSRDVGPMAWEAWVSHGLMRYASEWGTYAWTRKGAERKARKLMRGYLGSCRGPIEEVRDV